MLLQNLQTEFAECILSGESQTYIVTPVANLTIYQNNVLATLTNVLLRTYPLITKLLGEDFFRRSARNYIQCYPSRSGNLHEYGEYFSHFLAEYPPVKNLTYLPEVAHFEWICHNLYFAPDHIPLDIKVLQNIAPDNYDKIHLALNPASYISKFHYPILRIIELCQGEIAEIKELNAGGMYLLIIRREFDISLVPLSVAEYTFLKALHEAEVLATALEAAIQKDINFSLTEKLPYWIKNKTIVDCYLAHTHD